MPIDLYYMPSSSPCRSVLLVAKALGLELNLKYIDLQKGEHLQPEFIKINPQHTIPTIVDNGFALWESRAILTYLITKYGKDSGLYPEEPEARALVDQRLYFDMGTLGSRFADYFYPQIMKGAPADSEKKEKVEAALKFLDTFLEGQKFVAGPTMTVADLSLIATVTNIDFSDIDYKTNYPNIKRWCETMKKTAPGYVDINEKGLELVKSMLEKMLKK